MNITFKVPRPISSGEPYMAIQYGGNASNQIGPLSAEQWSVVSKMALATFTSQGTVGGMLLAGFVS